MGILAPTIAVGKSAATAGRTSILGRNPKKTYVLILGICVISIFNLYTVFVASKHDEIIFPSLLKEYNHGLAQCHARHVKAESAATSTRTNPRFVQGTRSTLIKNATVIDGDGKIYKGKEVFLDDGIVVFVGDRYDGILRDNVQTWDAAGRYVTPGLVDMHSHHLVNALPGLEMNEDTNEISDPITSQVRSIDGMDQDDVMIERIMSGGVTTSLILPGSANIMGGEAYVVKNKVQESLNVEDLLLQAGVKGKKQRWMKMACGENPKRVYPDKVNTRLGEAWSFRHRFDQAQQLLKKQDLWCDKAEAGLSAVKEEPFPSDLELESVVAVLRGDVKVNIHCYELMDFASRIRESREFGFEIAAFHHALDAYRVPEMLKDAPGNITIATFSNLWGYKKEAFQQSPYAGAILAQHGVPLAFKSDHPVSNSQNLIYQPQIARHYGLSDKLAMASVTGVPAQALGLGHRVGFLRAGYDADVALWDHHPLDLAAHPVQVWIDGQSMLKLEPAALSSVPLSSNLQTGPKREEVISQPKKTTVSCQEGSRDFVIEGIETSLLRNGGKSESTLVFQDGKITCFDSQSACSEAVILALAANTSIFKIRNAVVAPGITALAPDRGSVGLVELPSEKSTMDGKVDASHPLDPSSIIVAADGIVFGGKIIDRARSLGVVEAVTAPHSGAFLRGVSSAFRLNAKNILEPDAISQREVALHFSFGVTVKDASTPSVSTQMTLLRKILSTTSDKHFNNTVYEQASNGSIPVVIEVNNADEIGHLILLKNSLPAVNLVIYGGVEAYLVAEGLAKADIPVLLDSPRCQPLTWRTRYCLPGPPLSLDTNLGILRKAGVKVGIAGYDNALLGEAYWEAAWAAKLVGDMSEQETVDLVSTNVREILGLPKAESFVIFEGNPLDFNSRVAMIVDAGQVTECFPQLS